MQSIGLWAGIDAGFQEITICFEFIACARHMLTSNFRKWLFTVMRYRCSCCFSA